jgi:hypothetical protein
MRLAVKLLEKGENPIFRSLDELIPLEVTPFATPHPLRSLDCSYAHPPNYTHMQFPSHRLRVGFQKSGVKYRSYLLRAKSVDRLPMS